MSAAPSKGTEASVWARHGDDTSKNWRNDKEPGAALRGIPDRRSRGGGRGRGRTRAMGRGGEQGPSGRGLSERAEPLKPSESPSKVAGRKVATTSDYSPALEKITTSIAQSKERVAARTTPRPTLTLEPTILQSSDASSPLSPSKPSSRRRRNTHKHGPSVTLPKSLSSARTNGFPASPSAHQLQSPLKDTKDLPPHLTGATDTVATVHDIRKDIINLVDHVRSVAIRPSSPSTHIDWAGDDDDSLPDLDDWGVSSKLISDAGSASKAEPDSTSVSMTTQDSSPLPTPETKDVLEQIETQLPSVNEEQGLGDDTTKSMSCTTAPVAPAKRERERRRERGGRRDKEKKPSNAAPASQVNGSPETQVFLTGFPKKSLLERLSSPVRADPPALPPKSKFTLSQRANQCPVELRSPPLYHTLPPKPVDGFSDSRFASKPHLPQDADRLDRLDSSPSKENSIISQTPKPVLVSTPKDESVDVVVAEISSGSPHLMSETKASHGFSSSFDWSEEPAPFDSAMFGIPKGPEVGVEPPTPLEENVATSDPTQTLADTTEKPGVHPRMQRPLSTDITSHQRRERSPYKKHNARNHSAPDVGLGPAATRTRAPHATRPVIRRDAFTMISRSLGESPPPRQSPAPTTEGSDRDHA